MNSPTTKPRLTEEIMQRDVFVIHDNDSLQEAMQLMTENHVTGLPVVNSKGKCVGVITATDILNYEQEHSEFTSEANADLAHHFNPDTQQWESVRVTSFALEEFGEVRVDEVMTRSLLTVEVDTPIEEVARLMRDSNVHRVLVVSEENRLFGIVSSFDFVRLYAETK